jgi:hypothetical protein
VGQPRLVSARYQFLEITENFFVFQQSSLGLRGGYAGFLEKISVSWVSAAY